MGESGAALAAGDTAAGAASMQVTLKDAGGKEVAKLILGKEQEGKGGANQ